MTSEGSRKIQSLVLEIFVPSELDSKQYQVLKRSTQKYPVNINLENLIGINLTRHR